LRKDGKWPLGAQKRYQKQGGASNKRRPMQPGAPDEKKRGGNLALHFKRSTRKLGGGKVAGEDGKTFRKRRKDRFAGSRVQKKKGRGGRGTTKKRMKKISQKGEGKETPT